MKTIAFNLVAFSFLFSPFAKAAPFNRADVKETKKAMERISAGLARYYMFCQSYPLTQEGLEALHKEVRCHGKTKPALMAKIGQDAWHHSLKYISDGKSYKLMSLGRDGKEGGDGANTDIMVSH